MDETPPVPLPPAVPVHLILPPLAVALAVAALGPAPHLTALAVGAAGWLAAMVLRAPVALAGRAAGLAPERLGLVLLLASGPVEEACRLAALWLWGGDLRTALWLGLGWALGEALALFVGGLVSGRVLRSPGDQGDKARAHLAAQGKAAAAHPAWGGLERLSVTGLHVGLSLWIAWNPWLAVPAALAHTAVNAAAATVMKRTGRMALTEAAVAVPSAAVLAVGLVLALALS